MNKEALNPVEQNFDDEIDLRDIFIPLWKAKYRILLFGLICLSLTLVYSLGGFIVDKSNYASIQVHFNFQGVENGTFPNGEKFSPQELISGSVLSEVYRNIDSPSFDYADLVSAINVTPDFNGADELKSVVTGLLSKEKGLTNQEYSDAVSEYTNEIIAQSKKNVILTIDLNLLGGDLKKSSDLLHSIPKIWAANAIEDRGVLAMFSPTISALDIRINSGELLIQVNVLGDTHSLLSKSVAGLSGSLDNQSITDPASGMAVADLRYKLDLENKYRISILKELVVKNGVGVKNESWYKGFRDARLGKLERERSSLERMVDVYEQALVEFNQQQYSPSEGSKLQGGGSSGTTVYSPQYGEDVINRLMELGSKMSDPEYRKRLLQEKIDLSTKLQTVITEINFYDFKEPAGDVANISVEEISNLIAQSFKELEEIHSALLGIIQVSNLSSLDDRGELFDLVGSVQENVSSNLSQRVMLKAVLAFILGCILGMVVVFGRRVLR
jgi:capsular polysaccharide biosynthesis protein